MLEHDPIQKGERTNDWYARHEKRQYSHEVKGWLLYLQRTDLIVVPYDDGGTGWYCVIACGSEHYQVGGYNLYVPNIEIECAIQLNAEWIKIYADWSKRDAKSPS